MTVGQCPNSGHPPSRHGLSSLLLCAVVVLRASTHLFRPPGVSTHTYPLPLALDPCPRALYAASASPTAPSSQGTSARKHRPQRRSFPEPRTPVWRVSAPAAIEAPLVPQACHGGLSHPHFKAIVWMRHPQLADAAHSSSAVVAARPAIA